MSPLPAILALENPWVHVCSPDSSNILSYIEAPIDEHLGIGSTLDIPYINSYDGHVRLG